MTPNDRLDELQEIDFNVREQTAGKRVSLKEKKKSNSSCRRRKV
jgi:hypothetical protein